MKRESKIIEQVADIDNLRLAFWKARKAKDGNYDVDAFRQQLDKNLLQLRNEILSGQIQTGNYTFFKIHDPKERQICAAAFKERVLHHALMNICHSNFEKYQIFHSYASRKGKGTYAAIAMAFFNQKKYKWFLKLDVRKYFDSIDHAILKSMLAKRFKDNVLLQILFQIIDSYQILVGKGLPIGNLTSQYFANHYLSVADHYLIENIKPQGYVRYMDDMVLWHNDKSELLKAGYQFVSFINTSLKLELKPFCLNSNSAGLPFCGYLIFSDKIRLTQKNKKRFIKKNNQYENFLITNQWSQKEYQSHILPLMAFAKHADSFGLRKKVLSEQYRASTEGANRVNRGGSWNNNAQNCRSANRNNNTPTNRNNNLGFRVVSSQAHRHSRIAVNEQVVDPDPSAKGTKTTTKASLLVTLRKPVSFISLRNENHFCKFINLQSKSSQSTLN